MPKQIRTRPVAPRQARAYLGKAEEYLEAAGAELEAGRAIAAASLAVHAGINAADAVTGMRLGQRAAGQDHDEVLALLRQAGADGAAVERDLVRLLPLKRRPSTTPTTYPERRREEPLNGPGGVWLSPAVWRPDKLRPDPLTTSRGRMTQDYRDRVPTRMAVPDAALAAIRRYCNNRVPPQHRDEVRVECDARGKSVTIYECRPPRRPDLGPEWSRLRVAQLRYDPDDHHWRLYWADRNGRWHPYDDVREPTTRVPELLAELDADPTGIFWG